MFSVGRKTLSRVVQGNPYRKGTRLLKLYLTLSMAFSCLIRSLLVNVIGEVSGAIGQLFALLFLTVFSY